MLKNYIKIAIRNILKYKGYSGINIFGLSIAVAATIILSLYAYQELTYDAFNEHAEDTYLVYKERVTPSGTQDSFDTWVPLKGELEASFPSVLQAVRIYNSTSWIEIGNNTYQDRVTYTDKTLFDMFSFSLNKGDADNPFPNPQSVVVSEEMAQKYFGNDNPVGRTIRLDYNQEYTVSGVLNEIPENSSIQIDLAVPMISNPDYGDFEQNWSTSFLETFVRLQPGIDQAEMEANFPSFVTKIWDAETAERTNFKLLPLLEYNNRFTNSFRYAYIHLAIALVIILIACINFMNMATARSMERAREVGLRKAIGAQKGQLIMQFIGEAFVLSLLSVVAGILIAELALPYFNSLYNVNVGMQWFGNEIAVAGLLAMVIVLTLCAGGYPAFFLSRFSSIYSLRGRLSTKPGGAGLRQALVVVQFAITVLLIVGTLVVNNQISFMKSADLGFKKENTLAIEVSQDDFDDPEEAAVRLNTFKNEIKKISKVISVSSSEDIPGNWSSSFTFAIPEGWTNEEPMRVRFSFMDHNFFGTFGIELIEGRNFREGSESDMREGVIINESALTEFGWESGAGKYIGLGSSGNTKLEVLGVVKDYHFQSLQNDVAPILHVYRQPENGVHNFITIQIQGNGVANTLSGIEDLWNIMDSSRKMNYFFLDDNFDRLYRRQEQLAAIAGSFSILALIIACLGLLALVSLSVQQRKKEIGVRKVLGASTGRILVIVSRDFLKLVAIGFLLAVPAAYYLMNQWLQNYAYHIELGIAVFLLSGLVALLVSLIVVGFEATKAALTNPVDSLRSE
jgi:putative ABC transport system permease protein